MKPAPNRSQPAPASAPIDRVIRWSLVVFVISTLVLVALGAEALSSQKVAGFLNAAGLIYTVLCTLFLVLIGIVFVQGHLVPYKDIEAPKLELFELEKRE